MGSPGTGNKKKWGGERQIMEESLLEKRSWRNWFLLAAVAVITTIGLVTAIPPLITGSSIQIWPWAKTDLALLVGLSIIVLTFVIYLTQQQRYVVAMRKQLKELEEKANQYSEKYTSRLYALLNVSRIMSTETDLQGVFDCITRMCAEIFDCNRASIMLFDPDTQELVVRSTSDRDKNPLIMNKSKKIGDGIAGWVAKNRKPLLLRSEKDLELYPHLNFNDREIKAAMVVPIILRDELVGVLNISTHSSDVIYEEQDLQALQIFAENAGACIRHTERAIWMRKTIENLQRAIPSKS